MAGIPIITLLFVSVIEKVFNIQKNSCPYQPMKLQSQLQITCSRFGIAGLSMYWVRYSNLILI